MNDEEWQRHLALRELLAWASRRRPDPGDWLDTLLLAYRADGQFDAVQTRGELLAAASTAQRVAGLDEGVELMHEGLDEHTESLAALQREFAKPFPDRANLYRFLGHALPGCVSDCLAGMRDDLRRWAAQANAADARALAAWRPSLNAVAARLDDLCERYLLLERCIRARFSERELWEAHDRSLRDWHAGPEFQAWVAAGAPFKSVRPRAPLRAAAAARDPRPEICPADPAHDTNLAAAERRDGQAGGRVGDGMEPLRRRTTQPKRSMTYADTSLMR